MKELIISELKKNLDLSEEQLSNLIEVPPTKDLGDYAFPCFPLAKTLKKSPNEIALDLAKKIKSDHFERVEARGPYVNFFIDRKTLAKETLGKILKEKQNYGRKKINKKVLIEFPSPNTNKPLHIGHGRNIILSQAISNIMEYQGNKVIKVNLNNDRGIHICKSMLAYKKFGKNSTPQKSKIKSDHFVGDFYVKFAEELKKDPELEKEAQEYLKKWENNDKEIVSLWKKMNFWALSGFKQTYKKLNLKFKKEYLESEIYEKGREIILEGLKKGVFQKKQDGSISVNLEKEGLGEKILLRADGTSIYITQDLALAFQKQKDFSPDESIVVTAQEQNHHFKVLFKVLELLNSKLKNQKHYSYGMVNLESGRMKSREGTVVDLDGIIKELEDLSLAEIEKRFSKLSKKEKKERAEAIALSALKYYFLRIDHTKDITFKPEESISFEGNTGSYLLYTYARAQSVLKKSGKKIELKNISFLNEIEKSIILQLSLFPEVVEEAYLSLSPNIISNYAYSISQKFNEFYHSIQVIGSENENLRLVMVKAFAIVLKQSLLLLDIKVLEKM
ncbi:MAG: arginine--tRNA ligase [Nanoarchaeota archaeon]